MSSEDGGNNSWPGMDLRMTPNFMHYLASNENEEEPRE